MVAVRGTRRAAAAAAVGAAFLFSGGAAANCGRRLESNPEEFAACKDGSTVCYFFKDEEPFIVLPKVDSRDDLDVLEKPFECGRFAEPGLNGLRSDSDGKPVRLGGFGFGVLDVVTKRAKVPALCFLAGPDCTFNELVDYLGNAEDPKHPASGMLLGITGLLVFTPRRVVLGISSAPVYDDEITFVQRRKSASGETDSMDFQGAWRAAKRPFATNAWALCWSAFAALVLVVIVISLFRPTPFLMSKTLRQKGKKTKKIQPKNDESSGTSTRLKFGYWMRNFIHNTIGGGIDPVGPVERNFEPASKMLRLSLAAIIALTVLYYEAALIVGSPEPTMSRPVRGQSDRQLCSMAVLRDSALEESIAAIVDSGRGDGEGIDFENLDKDVENQIRTWATCEQFGKCFEMVEGNDLSSEHEACDRYDAKVDYLVAFKSVALHQFRKVPKYCERLELVQTQEPLFEFNGGWMYSRPADGTVHKSISAIDIEIRNARRDGTSERLLTEAVGSEIDCPNRGEQVFAILMLIPILGALIAPVLCALILTFALPFLTQDKD